MLFVKTIFNLDQIAYFFELFETIFKIVFPIIHYNLDRTNLCTICLILYLNNIFFVNVVICYIRFIWLSVTILFPTISIDIVNIFIMATIISDELE
jgi:hypothetical protein